TASLGNLCQGLGTIIESFICNRECCGFLPMPLKSQQSLQEETENFVHMLIEAMSKLLCPAMMDTPQASPHSQYPQLMLIFMINLKRQKDRQDWVLQTLSEQEIAVRVVEAVGGKALNTSQVKALSVNTLPGSRDPYSSSHCYMWKEVVNRELGKTLVTEDDVCCEHQFKRPQLDWELITPPRNFLHSLGSYMEYYESRDLKAFPAEPLLVYPTRYTGQPGYLSDTETSTIWDKEAVSRDWDRTHPWKSPQHGKIHSDAQNKDALPSQSPLNAPSSRDELWLPASRGTVDS
uniref:Glycosyl transferase family 25 domain-containing protein n=1 Tax=Amazona collaria TaxID=241587 RepID=A0A8B9FIC4_9PSIT